jgi:hypothetical protein
MLEKQIEKKVCDYAKLKGWMVVKNNPVWNKGIPDRMFMRNGVVLFIEFKRKGGVVSPLQQRWLDKLTEHNIANAVIDSVDNGIEFFNDLE